MVEELREIRLIFANYENAPKPVITISVDATVKDLKTQLQSIWPKDEVPLCEDFSRIRLICKDIELFASCFFLLFLSSLL